MGTKRNVTIDAAQDKVKVVEAPDDKAEKVASQTSTKKGRSPRYQAARAQVDKTKSYPIAEAIELAKKTAYGNFTNSLEAHAVLRKDSFSAQITLPNATGKKIVVEIASEDTLNKIAAGDISFDYLVASPDMMPKLAKHARVLGPKGLMPNPKNGTVTANPEAKKKELEAGSFMLKTEKKAPLIHVVFGNQEMPTDQLEANLQTLIKKMGTDLLKLSISASMGPGIKVAL